MIEATAATTGTPLSASAGQQQKSQFLQLLVAQLKGQDPLNPMDGTQFASQLAQFSSLEELINIREVMENVDSTLQMQQQTTDTVAETDTGSVGSPI